MKKLEQKLSFLLLGQGGGKNRARIIDLLKDRPSNINQIADELDLNYQTVDHHVQKLVESDILMPSKGGDYGKVYFLNERLENNFEIFEKIAEKMEIFTASPVLLRNLLKQSDIGFVVTDVNEKTIFWNRGAERIFGIDEEEVLGKSLDEFFEQKTLENFFKEIDEEERSVREVEIKSGSDEIRFVEMIGESVHNLDKEFIGYSILVIDITERKRSEMEKKRQYNVLTTIMENTDSQLVYFDRDFNFVYVNSAYAERAGYTREELIGKNHFDLFPDEENRRIFEEVRDSGEAVSFKDKSFTYPDEEDITYWDWTLTPVKDREGDVQGFVLSLIETTDRVEYEQEIEDAYERIEFLNSLNESIKSVNRLFVRYDDLDKMVQEIPAVLLDTKGFINITLAMFDDEGVMSPMSHSGVHEKGSWTFTKDGVDKDAPGCVKEVLKREEEVLVEQRQPYCENCPHIDEFEDHQTAVIPMKEQKDVIGVIRACYEPEVEIDEKTLAMLRELAEDIVHFKEA